MAHAFGPTVTSRVGYLWFFGASETFDNFASQSVKKGIGDRPLNCKSPPLAGFSTIIKGQFSSGPAAWLAAQC
jgi:hypothetical protein